MKRFIVEESERLRILKMHKAILNEQKYSAVDLQTLRKYISAGCLTGGRPRTNQAETEVFYWKPGKNNTILRFYANGTYTRTDASGKVTETKKYTCDQQLQAQQDKDVDVQNVQQSTNYEKYEDLIKTIPQEEIFKLYKQHPQYPNLWLKTGTQRTKAGKTDIQINNFIGGLEGMGYSITNPDPSSTNVKAYEVPKSKEYFIDGLIAYYSPESLADETITDEFGTKVDAQDIAKGDCKAIINKFYNAFKTKKTLDAKVLQIGKDKTQACANQYYGNWSTLGIFDGGNKLDRKIDALVKARTGNPYKLQKP